VNCLDLFRPSPRGEYPRAIRELRTSLAGQGAPTHAPRRPRATGGSCSFHRCPSGMPVRTALGEKQALEASQTLCSSRWIAARLLGTARGELGVGPRPGRWGQVCSVEALQTPAPPTWPFQALGPCLFFVFAGFRHVFYYLNPRQIDTRSDLRAKSLVNALHGRGSRRSTRRPMRAGFPKTCLACARGSRQALPSRVQRHASGGRRGLAQAQHPPWPPRT